MPYKKFLPLLGLYSALFHFLPLNADGGGEKESAYWISSLQLSYPEGYPQPLDLQQLSSIKVALALTEEGFAAPFEGEPALLVPLKEVGSQEKPYLPSALQSISSCITRHFLKKGYLGVMVAADPYQIDNEGNDLRQQQDLRFYIYLSCARSVKARAETVEGQKVFGHRYYEKIAAMCPQKCLDDDEQINDCTLNAQEIDDYIYRLNRYPGRRINAEIDGYVGDGTVDLTLVMHQDRPYHFWLNAATVGTQSTGLWIESAGFVDYQATHHDDTLYLSYVTANFSSMHAVTGSYEFPIWFSDRLRGRLDANYSTFDTQPLELQDAYFRGWQWRAGPSLIANVYQYCDLFLDASLGLFAFEADVQNDFLGTSGKSTFLFPTFDLSLERSRKNSTLNISGSIQTNLPNVAHTAKDLSILGRTNVNDTWWLCEFSGYGSYSTKDKRHLSLSDEIALTINGQYAFNWRLIPQKEGVIGGLYSVRGYPQSCAAGDNAGYMQAEYRVHYTPLCYMGKDANNDVYRHFHKWTFRLFFDAGRAVYNRAENGEISATLASTGAGMEYRYKNHLCLRADWGLALKTLPQSGTKRETGRLYGSFSWIY